MLNALSLSSRAKLRAKLRLIALPALLLIASTACHEPIRVVDQPASLPVAERETSYQLAAASENLLRVAVANAYGRVTVTQSKDGSAHARVLHSDGYAPGVERVTLGGNLPALWVVEEASEIGATELAQPYYGEDGALFRNMRALPIIEVELFVPRGCEVDIRCASEVVVRDIDAQISARAGVRVRAQHCQGLLRVQAPKLDVHASDVEIRALIAGDTTLSNVNGDKLISGDGDVVIHGGSGYCEIDVAGDVFLSGAISPSRTRTVSVGGGDAALEPRGPVAPGGETSEVLSESAAGSSIRARSVDLILPVASQLDLDLRASRGEVQWNLSSNAETWLAQSASHGLEVREASSSQLNLSLNGPTRGELRVRAQSGVTLLIDKR